MTNEELLDELRNRFPGIDDPDEEMDGGDAVQNLVQWFFELGGEMVESTQADAQYVGPCEDCGKWLDNTGCGCCGIQLEEDKE